MKQRHTAKPAHGRGARRPSQSTPQATTTRRGAAKPERGKPEQFNSTRGQPERGKPERSKPRSRAPERFQPVREETPSAARLSQMFAACGMRLSEAQVNQFWTFHQLLRRRNDELDLTRLHGFETIVLKHYVDCALVATLVDLPSPLLDLGTGAGFPGIPLKIVRPDLHLILAEPRPKRVAFLEEAVQALGLRDVEIVPQRIGVGFERPVRGVITRAVASIPATLGRLEPWLAPGALALFMKGPSVDDELTAIIPGFRLRRDLPYSIPGTQHARRLVVLERTAVAPVPAFDDDATLADGDTPEEFDGEAASESVRAVRAPAPREPAVNTQAVRWPAARDTSGREVRTIHSDANPTFKLLRTALTGRGIRKHGHALLAGMRPILEVVRDFPERVVAWVTSEGAPAPPATAPSRIAWVQVSPACFRELDAAGTGGPLLLIAAPPLPDWNDAEWPDGCTLFVPFQDPENVGAVLRTAAAFGVARVVLLQEAANPFHPRSTRAAGSALLRVPMQRGPALADLHVQGAPLLPLATTGRDLGGFEFPARFGLLPGIEGPGLPDALRTPEALAIPMQQGTESLNAAAATAIALYAWSRQRS